MHRIGATLLVLLGSAAFVGCSDTSEEEGGRCSPNGSGAGLQKGAPWATYRADLRHTGVGVAEGPAQPTVAWTFLPAGDELTSYWPPTVGADGTIYAAGVGKGYAIAPDGTLDWEIALEGRPQGSPTIGGDGIVFFSMSQLNAVTPEGDLLWSYTPPFDDVGGTAAVGPDGSIYVSLEAVGLATLGSQGCMGWFVEQTSGSADPMGTPAIGADGTVYFGIDDALVAFDSKGNEKWRFPLGDVQHLSPVVGTDGTIYAVNGTAVTALTADGEEKWSASGVTSGTQFPPALSPDGQLYVPSFQGLRAFDADGTELWSVAVINAAAPVIDTNGVAYTSDSSCVAYAIAKDGTTLWSQALVSGMVSCGGPVMGADGTVYFTSPSAGLIAVKGQ